jgi:hypothetical protein
MKKLTRTKHVLIALSSTVLLIACGGGGGTSDTPPAPGPGPIDVPVAATTDPAAATEFVRTVVARGEANSDTPLIVGDAVLATSETADPVAI